MSMKTLIILAQSESDSFFTGMIVFLAIGLGLYFLNKLVSGKPSFEASDETTQEEIVKQLKAIKWILAIGFLYLMAVISGLLPAGTFS